LVLKTCEIAFRVEVNAYKRAETMSWEVNVFCHEKLYRAQIKNKQIGVEIVITFVILLYKEIVPADEEALK